MGKIIHEIAGDSQSYIDDGQFPVFFIVNLTATRNNGQASGYCWAVFLTQNGIRSRYMFYRLVGTDFDALATMSLSQTYGCRWNAICNNTLWGVFIRWIVKFLQTVGYKILLFKRIVPICIHGKRGIFRSIFRSVSCGWSVGGINGLSLCTYRTQTQENR